MRNSPIAIHAGLALDHASHGRWPEVALAIQMALDEKTIDANAPLDAEARQLLRASSAVKALLRREPYDGEPGIDLQIALRAVAPEETTAGPPRGAIARMAAKASVSVTGDTCEHSGVYIADCAHSHAFMKGATFGRCPFHDRAVTWTWTLPLDPLAEHYVHGVNISPTSKDT